MTEQQLAISITLARVLLHSQLGCWLRVEMPRQVAPALDVIVEGTEFDLGDILIRENGFGVETAVAQAWVRALISDLLPPLSNARGQRMVLVEPDAAPYFARLLPPDMSRSIINALAANIDPDVQILTHERTVTISHL